jgi:TolB-like protein
MKWTIFLSPNMDKQYLDDGMTKNTINALAGIDCLKITSRTFSFCFKYKSLPSNKLLINWGWRLFVKAV